MGSGDDQNRSEDLVQRVGEQMFLRDFVVMRPMFRKGEKHQQEKEAADLLVPFGDHLIGFQVRSKRETKPASEKTPVDFKRIETKIQRACAQLKTLRRAISARHLREVTNARGIRLSLDLDDIRRMTGVVVVDLVGEEAFPPEDRTAIYGGFAFDHDMPIHIFTIDVFETLAEELDTIPDFLKYLETREALLARGILIYAGNELDFLSVYKTQPGIIQDCVEGRLHSLALDHGLWNQYKADADGVVAARNRANEVSGVMDNVIEGVWLCIGHDTGVRFPGRPDWGGKGTEDTYYRIALELSRLTRMDRRLLGERFLEKGRKAAQTGNSLLLTLPWGAGVVILASKDHRQARCERLAALAGAAHAIHNLEPVLGVVTEAYPDSGRSFDYALVEGFSEETKKEIAANAKGFFADPEH